MHFPPPPCPTPPPATQPSPQPSPTPPPPSRKKPASSASPTSSNETSPGSGTTVHKPSDYFQITTIDIKNGTLLYDARQPDLKPFTLDGLTSTLNVNPNPPKTAATTKTTKPNQSASGEGWYVLDCKAAREPLFAAHMQGRINLNTGTLEFSPLTAQLALSKDTHDKLPPNIQRIVDRYQARGNLQCVLTGLLMFKDKTQTKLQTHLTLTDGHALIGHCEIPIQKLVAELRTENMLTRAKSFHAEILNGTVDAEGSLPFRNDQTASLHIHIDNVGLARTIRTLSTQPSPSTATRASEPPKIAGRVSGDISYSGPVANWNTQASGNGHLILTHGRIPDLPLLGDIFTGIRTLGKSAGINDGKPDDHAETWFLFQGDKIIVQSLEAHSTSMGMRSTGNIDRSGNVNLEVNAGPLERFEQILGSPGNALSNVTDNLARYHVTGKPGHLTIAFQMGPQ